MWVHTPDTLTRRATGEPYWLDEFSKGAGQGSTARASSNTLAYTIVLQKIKGSYLASASTPREVWKILAALSLPQDEWEVKEVAPGRHSQGTLGLDFKHSRFHLLPLAS